MKSLFYFFILLLALFSDISQCEEFAVNFENGAIGQIYHFASQKCLSWNNGFFLTNCIEDLNSSIFQIEQKGSNIYSIFKQNTNNTVQLAGTCYAPYSWNLMYYENKLAWNMNSQNNSSFNYSECVPFQCPYYFDYYNNNETNEACEQMYLNETSKWNLIVLNDSEALGELRYGFLLKNLGFNLCLTADNYNNYTFLSCNEDSLYFMFGLKLNNPNANEIINIKTQISADDNSSLTLSWENMNNESDFIYIIYYFDNINEFDGYICGSDKPNSPVSFLTDYSNGKKIIRANFTANDLRACHCLYQESNELIVYVKAIVYDKYNKIAVSKRFIIHFSRYGSFNNFVYIGNENSNETGNSTEIFDKTEEHVNIDLTKNLTLSFATQKYFNKELNQAWRIGLNSENKFQIYLRDIYLYDNYRNYFYPSWTQDNNNLTNELTINVNFSSLPSGYYYFNLEFRLSLEVRILEENIANNKAFYSTYSGNQTFYVGTTQEIEAFNKEENNDNVNYNFILIGVFAAAFALSFGIGIYCCLRRRKTQYHAKSEGPEGKIQTLEDQEKEKIQSQV